MADDTEKTPPKRPPPPSPYLFTLVLFGFGCWFFYDGWFNPEIEAVMFNRIGAPIFFVVAAWDGWRTRKRLREKALREGAQENAGAEAGDEANG